MDDTEEEQRQRQRQRDGRKEGKLGKVGSHEDARKDAAQTYEPNRWEDAEIGSRERQGRGSTDWADEGKEEKMEKTEAWREDA